MTEHAPVLAIVVPCYNECEVVGLTDTRLNFLLDELAGKGKIAGESYILYVDDGSTDSTWECLLRLCGQPSGRSRALRLGCNAGHQNALIAGLEAVEDWCDCVVTIDADLQDDISVIDKMLDCRRDGADVVYGVRRYRESDTWFKRNSARFFYSLMRSLGVRMVHDHSDFRLMSAYAVGVLRGYSERNLFLRGIIPSMGMKEARVEYDRAPRPAGISKYPLRKMLNFSADGITSFSIRPVRLIMAAGIIFLSVAAVMLCYVLVRYFTGNTDSGWTSLILSIWFSSGMILVALGVIGEYVGKIYYEVKRRPRYHAVATAGRSMQSGPSCVNRADAVTEKQCSV